MLCLKWFLFVFGRNISDVEEPDFGDGDFGVTVEELGLDHNVSVQDTGWHHLALGGCLDQALPSIGRIGDHKPVNRYFVNAYFLTQKKRLLHTPNFVCSWLHTGVDKCIESLKKNLGTILLS